MEGPTTSQQRVLISAPPLGDVQRRRYLAISCISNITRLQVLLIQPIAHHAVQMQMFVDGREVGAPRLWRVIDGGHVIDAGRGLPAVELIRKLDGGSRFNRSARHAIGSVRGVR
jgi:type VI secretion system protein VasI